MSKIGGLGGAFIYSENHEALASWYAESFGIAWERAGSTFYTTFIALDPDDPKRELDSTFSIQKIDGQRGDGAQPYMINLRIEDLDSLLADLGGRGIEPEKTEKDGWGSFAWIRDPDGNRIELYQPLHYQAERTKLEE